MSTDKEGLSYGQYLREFRLEKGIRLEDVSAETRIGCDILQRIEEEDEGALPADVFVKGFLRAYAETVGADGEEAVRRFNSTRKAPRDPGGAHKLYLEPRRRRWPILLSLFATLAALVLISLYLTGEDHMSRVEKTATPPPAEEKLQPAPEPEPEPAATSEAEPPAPPAEEPPSAPAAPAPASEGKTSPPAEEKGESATAAEVKAAPAEAHKLLLTVSATEETWMKVIIDGGKPKQYTLAAGDQLKLEAKSNFNLLIGNAGGVDLTFNGHKVEVPGKSGQVITLQLP